MTTLIPKVDLKNGGATPTGAINRPINEKIQEWVSVLDFGADATGATSSSTAFQNAVNGAQFVLVPAGNYLLDAAINVPDNVIIQGQGGNAISNIVVNANVNCFNVGSANSVNDLFITHNGEGIIINAPQKEAVHLNGNTFYATSAGATNPLIYVSGSFAWIRENSFNNARTFAYAISIDRTTGLIHIESHIEQNTFGGAGNGIRIWSSDNSARPEGIYITNNSMFGLSENLRIEQVLQCTISNNVFDQGGGYNVIFNPVNTGIQVVQMTNNYFSTPSNQSAGVAVIHLNPTAGIPLSQIGFTDNAFAFTGYGCALYSPASDITFVGNSFSAIGDTGISLDKVSKAAIIGNTFSSVAANNISLTDGTSGGPFSVDGNQFFSTAVCLFTKTTPSKFLFGITNTGNQLAGWSSIATTSSATPNAGYIYIPHGLNGTPQKSKIIASLIPDSLTVNGAVGVNVVTVDSTNVLVQVFYTSTGGSTYNVNLFASL